MMKIDQEDFNRKAQHILDTVIKPQVEKYEKAKAAGELIPKPRQVGASEFVFEDDFYDRLLKAVMVPREYFGKKEEE
jgi:hypothetical protein